MKIKRYRKIYRPRSRFTNIRFILPLILVVGALVFMVVSLWGPFQDFLNGRIEGDPGSSSSQNSSASGVLPEQPENPSTAGDLPTGADLQTLVPTVMPQSVAASSSTDLFIHQAKEMGANACVVELKDNTGQLYFSTDNEAALSASVLSMNLIDTTAVVEDIRAAGMEPVALLHAFRDYRVYSALTDGYVRYQPNPELTWLDNSQEAGGRPWLNPCSQIAQDYILDLVGDAIDAGFTTIMLDSVQFPEAAGGLNYAQFSEDPTMDKAQVLTEFMERVKQLAQQKGAQVIMVVEGRALFETDTMRYGGNPLTFGADSYAIDLIPANVGTNLTVGGELFENPAYDVYNFFTAALAAIEQQNPGVQIMPMIDCSEGVTAEVRDAFVQIVRNAGLSSWYLYSPTGNGV